MKRISAKMFFTVVWRGVCQACRWFFGLFGYGRKGWYARLVWGVFATSAAIMMAILTSVVLLSIGQEVYYGISRRLAMAARYSETPVCNNIWFHQPDKGDGYIFDKLTGERTLDHVDQICKPYGNDSLAWFKRGDKRGYFNMHTGKLAVEPKYERAWVFSDGLACVDDVGKVVFIDGSGKTVIDTGQWYVYGMDGYMFHGGYCVINSNDGDKYGLMDKTGKLVLPTEYESIDPVADYKYWRIETDSCCGVLDKDMNVVFPLTACDLTISIDDKYIDVVMLDDNTMKRYDMEGKLVDDFYIYDVETLTYQTNEIKYRIEEDEGGRTMEEYRPEAVARLKAYRAGLGYKGLITADGHVVTMPEYNDIKAIGPDLYLCDVVEQGMAVILNGKGEVVK